MCSIVSFKVSAVEVKHSASYWCGKWNYVYSYTYIVAARKPGIVLINDSLDIFSVHLFCTSWLELKMGLNSILRTL